MDKNEEALRLRLLAAFRMVLSALNAGKEAIDEPPIGDEAAEFHRFVEFALQQAQASAAPGKPIDFDPIVTSYVQGRAIDECIKVTSFVEPVRMTSRFYTAPLVGEQYYQEAIAACREGDIAVVWRETGNPHDDRALAVTGADGRTIGYLASESWIHRATLDEGQGCAATIDSIEEDRRGKGFNHVVIAVTLCDVPIGERVFTGHDA